MLPSRHRRCDLNLRNSRAIKLLATGKVLETIVSVSSVSGTGRGPTASEDPLASLLEYGLLLFFSPLPNRSAATFLRRFL